MRLISWNCQGAFRKKADLILVHNPDILVVQNVEIGTYEDWSAYSDHTPLTIDFDFDFDF